MATKDKRVDIYIESSAEFAKPILRHFRKIIHQACPDIQETIKWGAPVFEHHGIVCGIAAFKEHCALRFWKAALLRGYDKRIPIEETAMGPFGTITGINNLPPERMLVKYVKEACRLNAEGIKVVKVKSDKSKTLVVPPVFKKALSKNKKAMTTFEGFSYTNKKDYVEWITEAKTTETRDKRMETAIEWMTEGKIRNWKYVR